MCTHIEECLQLSDGVVQVMYKSVVEKTKENNRKVRKTNRTINQTFTPKPKHDKFRAQWASNISLENMLEKV
jgi:hypothetical protein